MVYDYDALPPNLRGVWRRRPLSVWRYRELLPVRDHSKVVTLNEGGTSLHRCHSLSESLGVHSLCVKDEGENPTGSFKDRGITVGVTKALELGVKTVACASTGNTSASLAAYAAKAGLNCIILIPSGKVALGKLAQAMIHGAKVISVRGNFDDTLATVREICSAHPVYLLNSINAFRLEGQKTLAMEVVDQLGHIPDRVVVPVGNAGNISAIWKGFIELSDLGFIETIPMMVGVQAEGASPIADAVEEGRDEIKRVSNPETLATAIRIGLPVNWRKALKAIGESGGLAVKVSDDEILEAQRLLAEKEGLFVEPASAASIAGLRRLIDTGVVKRDEEIVCVATGHGLKDAGVVVERFAPSVAEAEADLKSVENLLREDGLL